MYIPTLYIGNNCQHNNRDGSTIHIFFILGGIVIRMDFVLRGILDFNRFDFKPNRYEIISTTLLKGVLPTAK
jgi:hypothetical protein